MAHLRWPLGDLSLLGQQFRWVGANFPDRYGTECVILECNQDDRVHWPYVVEFEDGKQAVATLACLYTVLAPWPAIMEAQPSRTGVNPAIDKKYELAGKMGREHGDLTWDIGRGAVTSREIEKPDLKPAA